LAQSCRVLMQDKELMILPVISGFIILTVAASFLVPVWMLAPQGAATAEGFRIGFNVPTLALFGFYVVSYTVGIFFQCAIVAGASERLAGGDPTLGSALGAAWKRFPAILAWGVVAASVGMLLRAVEERSGWIGKIVVSLLGAAWSLATFFVVPVLVLEERSMGDTFKRSFQIVKERLGEALIGGGSIWFAAVFVFWLPLGLTVGLLFAAGLPFAALIAAAVGFAAGLVFFSALQSVYVASLYRFATVGVAPVGFDAQDFSAAFRRK
jgi:hypothetical protein